MLHERKVKIFLCVALLPFLPHSTRHKWIAQLLLTEPNLRGNWAIHLCRVLCPKALCPFHLLSHSILQLTSLSPFNFHLPNSFSFILQLTFLSSFNFFLIHLTTYFSSTFPFPPSNFFPIPQHDTCHNLWSPFHLLKEFKDKQVNTVNWLKGLSICVLEVVLVKNPIDRIEVCCIICFYKN